MNTDNNLDVTVSVTSNSAQGSSSSSDSQLDNKKIANTIDTRLNLIGKLKRGFIIYIF
jgi:hypothetical protein